MFLYLTKQGSTLNKEWWKLIIKNSLDWIKRTIPFNNIEAVVIFGKIQLSTDVIRAFLKAKTPVFFLSKTWGYFWKLDSLELKNVELLYKHIEASTNEEISLIYAKKIIISKIQNSIKMLQRWARFDMFQQKKLIKFSEIIDNLRFYIQKVQKAETKWEIRWYEWNASKIYFQAFKMFLPKDFEMNWRTRRPPKDEVNALLGLGYTFLAQTIQMILQIQGIEAQLWFFHKPKDLRTLLVLDIMEMYRAWIVDDLVIRLLNRWVINKENFFINKENEQRPVLLTQEWLEIFIREYYKVILRKSDEENFWNYKKLRIIEENIMLFKKAIWEKNPEIYKWFIVK